MSETIKMLRMIGTEEIHVKTNISFHSINAILEERFSDINHVQYIGFLKIMEDNLNMDLTELRDSYKKYREESGLQEDNRVLFVNTPKEEKNLKPIIVSGISIILILIFIFTFSTEKSAEADYTKESQNIAIKDATKNIDVAEKNVTQQSTTSVPTFNANITKTEQQTQEKHPFVLYPKEDLWIGVVNIDTDERADTITKEPYPLDEDANLLISLGHGYLKISLNGIEENLSDKGRVRYLYRNGKLSRISLSKFIELNKGKSW